MLANSGDRIPPWGVPVIVRRRLVSLVRTPALRNAFIRRRTRLSPNTISHPTQQGGVADFIEARLDIRLEHPLVVPGG